MGKMQELLEKDKERFLQSFAALKEVRGAEGIIQEELGRLLSLYNDQEENDRIKAEAVHMIEAVRAASGFLNCDGEAKIWSRSEYGTHEVKGKRSVWFLLFLIAGIGCTAGGFINAFIKQNQILSGTFLESMLLLAGGAVLLFFSGLFARKKTKKQDLNDLYAERTVDGNEAYRVLLAAVIVMDKNLEAVRSEKVAAEKKKILAGESVIDPKELELLASMLENAYGDRENNVSRQVISDIKYYLHNRKIDVVDYTPDKKAWFRFMPGGKAETICPAIAVDNVLIRKGLVSGE